MPISAGIQHEAAPAVLPARGRTHDGTGVGGYFTSHVPAIGGAIQRGDQQAEYWKPFFDGFPPVRRWLADVAPDVVVYNDHGLNFSFDAMPTFTVGAAARYDNADEGWGLPVYKSFKGHPNLSWHLIETLVEADRCDDVPEDDGRPRALDSVRTRVAGCRCLAGEARSRCHRYRAVPACLHRAAALRWGRRLVAALHGR
jgi:hypothetical protein